jgi:sugar phosphate isomerase/epimerase
MKSSVTIALVPTIKTGPWIYWHELHASMEKASQLGFDGVELFVPDGNSVPSDDLQNTLQRCNLSLAAVGTGAGKVIHGLTLTDPSPEKRAKAVAFISEIITFGARFGAPAIVGSMQGNVAWGTTKEQALNWLAEGLERLGRFAETKNVKLIYEPLNRYETNLINDLSTAAGFVRALRTQNVSLLADLFHMNIEEVSIAESIRANHTLIGHVHLADSNRRPGGMGHIPLQEVGRALKEIGYQGYVSAEAFPYPDPDTAAAQTIKEYQRYFQ